MSTVALLDWHLLVQHVHNNESPLAIINRSERAAMRGAL
jgi:hypothetical protein